MFESAIGGESIELYVEAACNHPFGVINFPGQVDEGARRWTEEKPGRLDSCELVVINEDARALSQRLKFLEDMLRTLGHDSEHVYRLRDLLDRAILAVRSSATEDLRAGLHVLRHPDAREGAVGYSSASLPLKYTWLRGWKLSSFTAFFVSRSTLYLRRSASTE